MRDSEARKLDSSFVRCYDHILGWVNADEKKYFCEQSFFTCPLARVGSIGLTPSPKNACEPGQLPLKPDGQQLGPAPTPILLTRASGQERKGFCGQTFYSRPRAQGRSSGQMGRSSKPAPQLRAAASARPASCWPATSDSQPFCQPTPDFCQPTRVGWHKSGLDGINPGWMA